MTTIGVIHSQDLSPDELASAIWIIKQYSLPVPMDQTLCGTTEFSCAGGHITKISNMPGTTTTNGLPDPNLRLTFPAVELIAVNQNPFFSVADPALSLYDQLPTCCPSLTTIAMMSDPSLQNFPNNFDLIAPSTLLLATFSLTGRTTITFPSHPLVSQMQLFADGNATEFIIDDSVRLPKLAMLGFGQYTGSSLRSIGNFTAKSFPSLTFLYPFLLWTTPPINLNLDLPSLTSLEFSDNPQSPNTNIRFANTSSLNSLTFYGGDITFEPGLDQFPNLKSVTSHRYNSSRYPFLTGYPPSIETISFIATPINTIPAITIPSTATIFDFSSNQIAMPIDFDTVLKNMTGNLGLNLRSNVAFQGPLDQEKSLCRLKLLYMSGTSITSVPDCFWCYVNEAAMRFSAPHLSIPPGFTCQITFEDTNLISIFKRAIIKGTNLGWGQSGGVLFSTIVPNEQLEAIIPALLTDGPPQLINIPFSVYYPLYTYPFNVTEAGFNVSSIDFKQIPNQLAIITVVFAPVNTYLSHNVSIDGVLATPNSRVANTYQFEIPNLSNGSYDVRIFNNYYSTIMKQVAYIQSYPIVDNFVSTSQYVVTGSILQFNGNFGTALLSSSIIIQNNNSQYNFTVCSTTQFLSTRISCITLSPISSGLATFNITVDGYSIIEQYTIQSAQQQCESDTNHCGNNGVCTPDGSCNCNVNQGSYYNDCSKPFPFATSGQVNDQNSTQRSISLFGDFGPFGLTNSSVTINNTMNCIIDQLESTQFQINCQLVSSPTTFGPASVQLNVNGSLFDSKTYLIRFIKPGGGSTTTSPTTTTSSATTGGNTKTPQEICEETTQSCFGHGYCDENGICQCEDKYNPVDNCLTKFADNTTYIPNPESPSTNISVDGVEFGFDIVAIQEIGLDNEIVKELLTNSWLSNITINSSLTNAVYQLVISNTSILFANTTTQVTVNMSFSQQSRTVEFGNQQLLINSNSIKMAVSINGWEYSSNVATLRVVIKTTTNNQQSIEYDCKETDIESFSYDDYGTLQYLRVLKDNVQFNGRFIDFALADGRTTYSQTLLINQTQISSNQSTAMIGISLPQCQTCILDPDFTPLLVVNDKAGGDCSSSDDNKWKIIVGCVVGGIGIVAIAIASVIYAKMKIKHKRHNKKMESKLREFN
ncbi:hypothetical protein DFA_01650 [Cavenderia fasciculata]|uniref:ComC supersandwich domain-containing protein n=1 Tax=Cavenderia fasciculata TaxID=261658 RepID=F4PTZ6_CACFS|nr:uncharacterized protein DFA_01650 [Cavenderia fasciculata]EGG21764.1 hypothetical protein DFA_01650 [Cavenderia fasciculata]|eukprot:XP_004359614.1 hypothetical protein DFA_01650 [Cavenderia fasciculata]